MRPPAVDSKSLQKPLLIDKTKELDRYIKTLSTKQIAKAMHVSDKLAEKTHGLISGWTDDPSQQRVAIDSFLGDIYSGLQVPSWTVDDRKYADKTLRILSGLYGIIRPLDDIYPYRLEMGYKLPDKKYSNLYKYWGDSIAKTLSNDQRIINLSAVEYSKTITEYIDNDRIISPSFLTINPKTKEPGFVVVHAKIARGAFANWLIKNRVSDISDLKNFTDLGYKYDEKLSTPQIPVFVCKEFGGIGLSLRLT